jgi:hypothetical protein
MITWTEALIEPTIVFSIFGLLGGTFTYRRLRKKGEAHPILRAVLSTITIGTALILLLVFHRLGDKGMIDETLRWYLVASTGLLITAPQLEERLARKKD